MIQSCGKRSGGGNMDSEVICIQLLVKTLGAVEPTQEELIDRKEQKGEDQTLETPIIGNKPKVWEKFETKEIKDLR